MLDRGLGLKTEQATKRLLRFFKALASFGDAGDRLKRSPHPHAPMFDRPNRGQDDVGAPFDALRPQDSTTTRFLRYDKGTCSDVSHPRYVRISGTTSCGACECLPAADA